MMHLVILREVMTAAKVMMALPLRRGEMMGEMMVGLIMMKGVNAWKVSMRKMIRVLTPKKSQ